MPIDAADHTRPNLMEIDTNAIVENLTKLRRMLSPGIEIIASVKGNAYGHGAVEVARTLAHAGVRIVATGSWSDALAVKRARIGIDVLMFGGALPEGVGEILREGFIATVHSDATAAAAIKATKSGPARVFVKVDCGHGRLGIPVSDAVPFVRRLVSTPNLELRGLYTHLPFGDGGGLRWAQDRLALFDRLVESLQAEGIRVPFTQARSSAGILAGLEDRCNAVCPGSLLYGKSPFGDDLGTEGFRPALSIRTRVVHVADVRGSALPGRFSGRAEITGVVPLGRADGYRAAQGGRRAEMLVRGQRVPVLGVSLEHCVIDLSAIPEPRVGEEVVVLGGDGPNAIALRELADWQGVTMSDVLMTFNNRMKRVVCGPGRFLDLSSNLRGHGQKPSVDGKEKDWQEVNR